MATNDDLEKQNKLLKDQAVEAGFLDNAYKSIAATLSNMFEDVIDNLNGIDTIGAKIAKSYERDIVGSIKRMSGGLEDNLLLVQKMNKGQNIAKDLTKKQEELDRRNLLTKEKINRVFGEGTDMAMEMHKQLDDTYEAEKNNINNLKLHGEEDA